MQVRCVRCDDDVVLVVVLLMSPSCHATPEGGYGYSKAVFATPPPSSSWLWLPWREGWAGYIHPHAVVSAVAAALVVMSPLALPPFAWQHRQCLPCWQVANMVSEKGACHVFERMDVNGAHHRHA